MNKVGIYYAYWERKWDADFVPYVKKVATFTTWLKRSIEMVKNDVRKSSWYKKHKDVIKID